MNRKKLIKLGASKNEHLSVLKDMSEWLDRSGGNPDAILSAERLFKFDSRSPAVAFVELTERMRLAEDIRCVDAESNTPAKVPVAIIRHCSVADRPERFQVRHWVINEVLRHKRVPAVRPEAILAELESGSALLDVIYEEQGTSWLVDAGWWNQTTATVRRRQRPSPTSRATMVRNDGPDEREFLVHQTSCEGDSLLQRTPDNEGCSDESPR